MMSRHIPLNLADAAGVRGGAWFDRRQAVIFPLIDGAGRLVAAQGRYITPGSLHMRTCGPKKHGVFVTPGALDANPVAVVEAPIDALLLALIGLPSIALCGTSWSTWLPEELAMRTVLLATDADEASDGVAGRLSAALTFGSRANWLRPEGGKDFNEALGRMGPERLRRQLFDAYAAARCIAV